VPWKCQSQGTFRNTGALDVAVPPTLCFGRMHALSRTSLGTSENVTRAALAAYVALALAPFLAAATSDDYWGRAFPMALIATMLFAALVGALLRRQRWAWFLLVLFDAGVLVSFAFDFTGVAWFAMCLLSFALLISAPVRAYVRG
jgi:hypothetical protein